MEIMNAAPKQNNLINLLEDQVPDYWNISYIRNNRILSTRKSARFIASLICQTHEIENKLKSIAEQKNISLKEQEIIKASCELYDQMLVLINKWKNLHFQNQENRESGSQINPWSLKISNETRSQDTKLIIQNKCIQ